MSFITQQQTQANKKPPRLRKRSNDDSYIDLIDIFQKKKGQLTKVQNKLEQME